MDVIIVYKPAEKVTKNKKEQFWNELQMVYEEADSPTMIIGDFNKE